MTTTVEPEFSTLDLAELDDAPLRPVRHVSAVSRTELPAILAEWLPSVVQARRFDGQHSEVHEFIDTRDGAAARVVLTLNVAGDVQAHVAESGPAGLWRRIQHACHEWETSGRSIGR